METKNEIWKPIEGYEDRYEVSNLGRVRSLDRYIPAKCALSKTDDDVLFFRKGKIIKLWEVYGGYFQASLSKGDKPKMIAVHRLVAKAFIPNPDNLPEVNHIDEDKSNNRVDNLEWCTRLYNEHHGTKIERAAKNRYRRPVEAYNEKGEVVASFPRIADAARAYGVTNGTLWQCCNHIGTVKRVKGLYWRYKE
jgi:hypothetical protein